MNRTISKVTADNAVFENASQIQAILENALVAVIDAGQADSRNGAMGAMLNLGENLKAAQALYDAAVFFHRHGDK